MEERKKKQRRTSSNATRRSSGGGMIRFQNHSLTQRLSEDVDTDLSSMHLFEESARPTMRTPYLFDDLESSSVSIGSINTADSSRPSLSNVQKVVLCFCCFPKRRSRTSLRSQIMIPFGILSFLIVVLIVGVSLWSTNQARNNILGLGRDQVDLWAKNKIGVTSRFVSDITSQKLIQMEGVLGLVLSMTQERFVGYPTVEDDRYVPFPNHLNKEANTYPWTVDRLLPLPTETVPTVNSSNFQEHTTTAFRFSWYPSAQPTLSTAHAMMVSQSSAATSSRVYPVIHRKVSDYVSPLFKSLFEYQREIKSLEIHFVNEGHGDATVVYPSRTSGWTSTTNGDSVGCEWLRLPNPHQASKPILGQPQRANCHAATDSNVLQQEWCRQQALNPETYHIDGPYSEEGQWYIRFGKAVYDLLTNELIACTAVVVNAASLASIPIGGDFRLLEDGEPYVALVRWDNSVVISALTDPTFLRSQGEIVHASDLAIGLNEELLKTIKQDFVRDYNANRTIKENEYIHNGRYLSVYPTPPPRPTDSDWTPELFTVLALDLDIRDVEVNKLKDHLDSQTEVLMRNILITGGCALVAVLCAIYVMSLFLTMPLKWMSSVGKQILRSAGSGPSNAFFQSDTGSSNANNANEWIDISKKPWWYRFSARNEVSELVEQFHEMVLQFSGKDTAKLFKQQLLEVKNPFVLFDNFHHLYEQRVKSRASYHCGESRRMLTEEALASAQSPSLLKLMEYRIHDGPNVHDIDNDLNSTAGDDLDEDSIGFDSVTMEEAPESVLNSALFWWIVVSIVLPLICCTVAISVYVIYEIDTTLPTLVDSAGDMYAGLERDFLIPFARLRAAYISTIVATSVRDLHVFNRMAGWTFTGSIGLTNNSFVEVAMAAEECKTSNPVTNPCPQVEQRSLACDCNWKDPWGEQCYAFDTSQRVSQLISFEGLREDAYPNGDRNFTSYPALATSPSATQFWSNVESLPGFGEKTTTDTLYTTTYDRARVAAAMSAIQVPLYNYVLQGHHSLPRLSGTYLAMERGGETASYKGCNIDQAYYALMRYGWQKETFNTDLCPRGKFGYDPRCLDWYVGSKEQSLNQMEEPLYISPPEAQLRSSSVLEVQLGKPLIDTRTDELIGISMARFQGQQLLVALSEEMTPLGVGSFRVMTAAGDRARELDVLVAPGFTFGDDPVSISEILLPNDSCDKFDASSSCRNVVDFSQIVEDMHAGGTDLQTFTRTSNTTGAPEMVSLTYAPVSIQSYRPIDPSDFSRGVRGYTSNVFSVALGSTEEGIALTFLSAQEALNGTLRRFVMSLLIILVVSLVVLVPVSAWISMSIAVPVTQLCQLVTQVNRSEMWAEFPEISGGSSEVAQLRSTFERLYKLLRAANMAFFMGDLDTAYGTLRDSLVLFTKLKNHKAIGIANNNLGNVMLTIYRAMKKTNSPTLCNFSRKKIIQKGGNYYRTAIDFGEQALKRIHDEEGFSVKYLIFMQQLSNRYFNRAMFLLTVRDDHPKPNQAEKQGLMDLSTCQDMDREVVDNGDHEGFKGDKDVYFELLLSRINGLLLLMKMGYPDPWGIEDLFEEARSELISALNTAEHPLFDYLNPAGQMQRLDSALVDYHNLKAQESKDEEKSVFHVRKGAEIAVRMLIEDDYVIGEASMRALKALIDCTTITPESDLGEDPSDVRSKLFQYRHRIGEQMSLLYSSRDVVSRECFNACNTGDFSMEVF